MSDNSVGRKQQSNISGYNLFAREMFSSVKNDNQNLATKDILRIVASLWKEQDQDIKDDYNQKAKSIKPLTPQEKKERVTNNKRVINSTNKTNTLNKNKDLKLSPKTSPSKLESVKSTPTRSGNEINIKDLLAKIKSPRHQDNE